MGEKDELERLQRLRDAQLASRDPRAKERAYARRMAGRRKDHYLTDVLKDLPYKIRWALWGVGIGLLVGLAGGYIVDFTFSVRWLAYIAAGVALWGGVIGYILGHTRDSGTEGWR